MQRALALLSVLLFTACDLAPEFALPKDSTPSSFKESEQADGLPVKDGSWKRYDDEAFARFGQEQWWKAFADTRLDALIEAGMKHSPTLAAAREKLVQARANAGVAEATLWPDITANAGANRQRQSPANPNIPPGTAQKPYNLYRAGLGIDYGLDLFGRARGAAKAANERVVSQKALLAACRLALQADIAQNYFTLLRLQEEFTFLVRAKSLRSETLTLTRKRFELGEVSDLDVARAEGELATTESELQSVSEQRANTEHMLAMLTGKAPADFAMPECTLRAGSTDACDLFSSPPSIPAGLPSALLERRPDIASAAAELSARNAQIGVARGAFFPAIDLTASFGYESASLGSLFDWSNRTWLLGPASGTFISLPIYTGGRNTANLLLAKSNYREQVANYRATLLTAFREVEDALVNVRTARERGLSQSKALGASKRAYRIAKLQYDTGYAGYLSLLDAERSLINAARGEVQARGDQFVSTVTLIRALGGGWGDVEAAATPEPAAPPAPKPKKIPVVVPASTPAPAATPAPKRLPRPWDKTKPVSVVPKSIAPKPQASVPAAPATLPFRKRNPSKPVQGLDVIAPPISNPTPAEELPSDIDGENAEMPFKRQGAH